jgi:hypothetical protein
VQPAPLGSKRITLVWSEQYMRCPDVPILTGVAVTEYVTEGVCPSRQRYSPPWCLR